MKKRKKTNRVIFHHSLSKDVSSATIRKWHVVDKGYSDIGYHVVIRADGTIEAGRDFDLMGAHAKGKNRDSIGVCLTGDFRATNPTDNQIASSIKVYGDFCDKYKKSLNVEFHRATPNPCPGPMLDRTKFKDTLTEGNAMRDFGDLKVILDRISNEPPVVGGLKEKALNDALIAAKRVAMKYDPSKTIKAGKKGGIDGVLAGMVASGSIAVTKMVLGDSMGADTENTVAGIVGVVLSAIVVAGKRFILNWWKNKDN